MKISLGANANTKRYPESCLGILHSKGASDMGTLGWWLQQETVVDTNHELGGDHKHLTKGVCLHQRTVAGSSYWEVTGSQNNAKRREKNQNPGTQLREHGHQPTSGPVSEEGHFHHGSSPHPLECGEEKATCLQRTRRRREDSADSWLQLLLAWWKVTIATERVHKLSEIFIPSYSTGSVRQIWESVTQSQTEIKLFPVCTLTSSVLRNKTLLTLPLPVGACPCLGRTLLLERLHTWFCALLVPFWNSYCL